MNSRFLKIIVLLAGIGRGIVFGLQQRASSPAQSKSPAAQAAAAGQHVLQPSWAGLKQWLLRLGILGALFGLGGFLLAALGVIPIKASAGHWAVTQWFLQFSKSRSVATHTLGIKAPALDDPGMVLLGAGHYETGCAPCHGSPHRPRPRIAEHMLPPPPLLKQISSKRDAAELFYIVKHGIKFTGMPAWPAPSRDDEIWAIVAFLRQLPEMDAGDYQRMVSGETRSPDSAPLTGLQPPDKMPRAVIESCGRCHGSDGHGRGSGLIPSLARQQREYLFGSLQAYARRERPSGIMGPVAAGLSSEAMRELADYYASLPARGGSSTAATNAEAIERGRSIAENGIPSRRVPACIECHGPRPGPRNPHYPVLAGQSAHYLERQLQLFSARQRGGTAYSHLMHFVAGHLAPDQMRDVASFFESLGGGDANLTAAQDGR